MECDIKKKKIPIFYMHFEFHLQKENLIYQFADLFQILWLIAAIYWTFRTTGSWPWLGPTSPWPAGTPNPPTKSFALGSERRKIAETSSSRYHAHLKHTLLLQFRACEWHVGSDAGDGLGSPLSVFGPMLRGRVGTTRAALARADQQRGRVSDGR